MLLENIGKDTKDDNYNKWQSHIPSSKSETIICHNCQIYEENGEVIADLAEKVVSLHPDYSNIIH